MDVQLQFGYEIMFHHLLSFLHDAVTCKRYKEIGVGAGMVGCMEEAGGRGSHSMAV